MSASDIHTSMCTLVHTNAYMYVQISCQLALSTSKLSEMIISLLKNKGDKALVSYSGVLRHSLGKNLYANNMGCNY